MNASSVEDIDPLAINQRLSNGSGRLASPVLQRLQLRDEGNDPVVRETQFVECNVKMTIDVTIIVYNLSHFYNSKHY